MMKRFKFGLVGLLLGLFGFTCFTSAQDDIVEDLINVVAEGTFTATSSWTPLVHLGSAGAYCIYFDPIDTTYNTFLGYWIETTPGNFYLGVSPGTWGCMTTPYSNQNFYIKTVDGNSVEFNYKIIEVNELLATAIPKMTSLECQSEYGLITTGSVDTNYCVSNDLCPVASGSWSELMINDIVHESAPFINITIPYEYSWDYTVDENEFDLVISGQNVDYEYIDGIIRTQQSKPNNTDFNNIVSGLIPLLIPGLVIILFLRFIFKFIKKIF